MKRASRALARPRFLSLLGRTGLLPSLILAGLMVASGCVTATIHRERGRIARDQGDLVKAEDEFRKSLDKDSGSPHSYYELGYTLLQQGRPLEAQTPLEIAYDLRSSDETLRPKVVDALAESYFKQGPSLYSRLTEFLSEEAGRTGDFKDYTRLADYMVQIGDMDAAALAYEKAAYFAPLTEAEPYVTLAEFYEGINDRPKAVMALRHALFIAPSDPEINAKMRAHDLVPGPTEWVQPDKPVTEVPEAPAAEAQ